MTKEKLIKEAGESWWNDNNCSGALSTKKIYICGYLAGAEPREKRIAELEKELEQAKKVQVVEHFEAYGQCRDSRRIAGLEKENAALNDKLKNLESVAEVRLANWQKYEEENKELKKKIENLQKYLDTRNCYRECAETWVKLTKAKELLTKVMRNTWSIDSNVVNEINKFLKECENER